MSSGQSTTFVSKTLYIQEVYFTTSYNPPCLNIYTCLFCHTDINWMMRSLVVYLRSIRVFSICNFVLNFESFVY